MKDIKDMLEEPILLEQMAEETAELTHALLKYSRILRGKNPTHIDREDAYRAVISEFSDVILCARALQLTLDEEQIHFKNDRWITSVIATQGDQS